jgi:hypothetical protein
MNINGHQNGVVRHFRIIPDPKQKLNYQFSQTTTFKKIKKPKKSAQESITNFDKRQYFKPQKKEFEFKKYVYKGNQITLQKNEKSKLKNKLKKQNKEKNDVKVIKTVRQYYPYQVLKLNQAQPINKLVSPNLKKSKRMPKLHPITPNKKFLKFKPKTQIKRIANPAFRTVPTNVRYYKVNGQVNSVNYSLTDNSWLSPKNSIKRHKHDKNMKIRLKEGERLSTSIVHSSNYFSDNPNKIESFHIPKHIKHSEKNIKNDFITPRKFHFIKNNVNLNDILSKNKIKNMQIKEKVVRENDKNGIGKSHNKSNIKEGKGAHINSQSASNLKELLQKFKKNNDSNQYEVPDKVESQMKDQSFILQKDNKSPLSELKEEEDHSKSEEFDVNTPKTDPIQTSNLLKKIKQIDKVSKNEEKDIIEKRELRLKDNLIQYIKQEQKDLDNSMHMRSKSNINLRPQRVNRFESLPPVRLNSYRRPNKSILRKSKTKK